LDADNKLGDEGRVFLRHSEIFEVAKPGMELLLDDGKIRVRVESVGAGAIATVVIDGGVLSNRKGLSIPGATLLIDAITEKDRADAQLSSEINPEWVAISFVQSVEDVVCAREVVAKYAKDAKIIAKIEKHSAIVQIDAILAEADAIMVARGDLGVETPFEAIPIVQAKLVKAAKACGKPVIVATQMLESMVNGKTPTRAEVTDIAYATALGADGLMLSAETASGANPAECVRVMAKVTLRIEREGFRIDCSATTRG
jgi:pyruvate kinase